MGNWTKGCTLEGEGTLIYAETPLRCLVFNLFVKLHHLVYLLGGVFIGLYMYVGQTWVWDRKCYITFPSYVCSSESTTILDALSIVYIVGSYMYVP